MPPKKQPDTNYFLRRAKTSKSNKETLAQAVYRNEHPRIAARTSVEPLLQRMRLENDPMNLFFIKPRTELLRGLRNLDVITSAYFYPRRFVERVINRVNPPQNPASDVAFLWKMFQNFRAPMDGAKPGMNAAQDALIIPLHNCRELPTYVFLYVLNMIARETRSGNRYNLFGTLTPYDTRATTQERIAPISVQVEDRVDLDEIVRVFNHIMGNIHIIFTGFVDDHDYESFWWGSEDSGTRIYLANRDAEIWRLKLHFYRQHTVRGGAALTPSIEAYLEQKFKTRSFITVRNTNDSECFLYTLILGIMHHINENWMKHEGRYIDAEKIRTRGIFYSRSETVKHISRMILEPTVEDVVKFEKLFLLKRSEEQISVSIFKQVVAEIEERIFECEEDETDESIKAIIQKTGIDVYILDEGISKHVYPIYMSRRAAQLEGRHIRLLCIGVGSEAHFILVTNLAAILRESAGKIFYNCGVCNQAFFTQRALKKHDCNGITVGKYHWSRNEELSAIEPVGYCNKCMLQFETEFEYEHHRDHCFMYGRSGYRHVRCIDKAPFLTGEEIDYEDTVKRKEQSYLLFADFESAIDPETGMHVLMSYGVYDVRLGSFKIGATIDEFIQQLYQTAATAGKIHVYFHNAMNYDANFILRHVLQAEATKGWSIKTIMKSSRRLQKLQFKFSVHIPGGYIGTDGKRKFQKMCTIDIGDVYLFITMSLERIVQCLKGKTLEDNMRTFRFFFEQFRMAYPMIPEEQVEKILRKNIFPYKFFTSSSMLDTPADDFIRIFRPAPDNLKYFGETVTVEELEKQYPFVEEVFSIFNVQSARDYHDIYLRCDVMQLADVFLATIETLWESHRIFLPDYIGMPAASWAAFLRHDPTMSIPLYTNTLFAEFFQNMTRGGVTSAPLRYAKADKTHSIIYLDVNGLYPYVMQAYKYPCGCFEWIDFQSVDYEGRTCNEFLLNEVFPQLEANDEGMCITVDLHYTRDLKNATDDFPFAPEHRIILEEYLNPGHVFLQKWSLANNGEHMRPFKGLVGTLYDKKQYTVHWRLLRWYILHGLIVTKIYWGVRFAEGDYLAGYVRKNIELRNQRTDELGKMVYKLMGNSIYGKTFESPFKRGAYEIIRDETKLQGIIDEDNVATLTPIDDLAWVVKIDGEEIILNKPTYIGACVVEYAKLHMYELFYDKLKALFEEVNLVYTDTDSFIVKLKHPESLSEPRKLFEYIKIQDPELIGGIGGQVKSETGEDDTIDEIIALRSKVYAYKTKKGYIGKRAKGTTKAAQDLELDWAAYKSVLEELKSKSTENMQFTRECFVIKTTTVEKQSLSANDGKRFICEDGIHTHAWGYSDKDTPY